MVAMTPIVKWVGGKTRLLPALRLRLPKTFKHYYEPFAGGAALFFAQMPWPAILGDSNAALINLYRVVCHDLPQLTDLLNAHQHANTRVSYYYEIRETWNQGAYRNNAVTQAAAFLYLNKTAYNGLWRVNKQGAFNAPRGSYDNPKLFDSDGLRAAASLLRNTQLVAGDYKDTTSHAIDGDFVYFDPPYEPLTTTASFTAYTQSSFGAVQQDELSRYARTLRQRGVHIMLSNNDTERIRQLYQGFTITTTRCARTIANKASQRVSVNEVIITSY
jgi:DNA adenine methylase